ncbi:MAG: D-aminoacylase [Armatimonadota bacterium]
MNTIEAKEPRAGASCDILLRGGVVYDGTGAPGKRADIAIRDERIVAIGALDHWQAGMVVDVSGLCVAPAFIDIHTHSDFSLLHHPEQLSMLYQGIGTQVVGNCGLGVAQTDPSPLFQQEQRWLKPYGVEVDWNSFDEHLKRVGDQGVGTNVIFLCAHGTLRKKVMNFDRRAPTAEELLAMQREVATCMEAGAWGFSTGLEYVPGSYADTHELIELAKIAAEYGGFYATHLRSEGDQLVESVAEALQIAEQAGLPLQLSHHKAEGHRNWGKVHQTLQMVTDAVQRGHDVMLDVYPYTAYQTSMGVACLPSWALTGEPKEVLERLRDPVMRQQILQAMRERHDDWETAVIGSVPGNRALQGLSVAQAAAEAGQSPEEFVLDLLLQEGLFVSVACFNLSEEDLRTVLRYPLTMIGSDGVGYDPVKMSAERPHPRCYGAFPRVLRHYVREEGLLTLEEAIFKMTGLPAKRLGLTDRGVLQPGAYADIVVFDFVRITDRATFREPHQLAEGVVHLILNGRWALRDGHATGTRAGKVLRRAATAK